MNRGKREKSFTLSAEQFNIQNKKLRDLWSHNDLGQITKKKIFKIPKHGIIVLRVD
jgi:alpha-galactosidase